MRKITLLALLSFTIHSHSQPVLNALDFPASYSATGFFSFNATGFTNGASGANVVWDYSAITPVSPGTVYSIVPVSEANASFTFPTANFCEKFVTNGQTTYNLYVLDNQSLQLVGAISTFVANYYDPATQFQFPYTYQNTFTDTEWQLGSPTPPEPVTRTYDAYGTLILPNGTYTNVIRQKITPSTAGIEYHWYGTNPYRLLMIGNLDFNYVVIFGESQLSRDQDSLASFRLYPNPTSDAFSIATSTANEGLTVKIHDVLGKLLFQNDNYIPDTAINIQDYPKGVYIVTVTDIESNQLLTKKVVKY
jgi:FlaG/FlaF family flagellin (archaellin)